MILALWLLGQAWAEPVTCDEHWQHVARVGSSPGSEDMGVLELLLRGQGFELPPEGWQPVGAATWREVAEQASASWHALVAACAATNPDPSPEAVSVALAVLQPPDPVAYAHQQHGSGPGTAGLLPAVVAAEAAGLPDEAVFQVAMAQVVTNGAPAFSGTMTTTPGLYATRAPGFLRHFTIGVDALVVTPPSTDPASALPSGVIFSSAGLYLGSTTTRDVADAYVEAARNLEQDVDAYEQRVRTALQAAVAAYASQDSGEEPVARALASRYAADTAERRFSSLLALYYEKTYLEPWRKQHRGEFDLALRARVTPDATWVPTLPDLLSLGLTAGGYVDLTKEDLPVRGLDAVSLDGAIGLYLSGYPTPSSGEGDAVYTRLDGAGRLVGGMVVDASLGLSLRVPTQRVGSFALIGVSGVGSGAVRWRGDGGAPYWTGAAGARGRVVIPVVGSLSMVGAYTYACYFGSEAAGTCSGVGSVSMAVGVR
jgi:hypothetical protein